MNEHGCRELYETPPAGSGSTHSCNLPNGHDGDHRCPLCGNRWINNRFNYVLLRDATEKKDA